MDCLHNNKKGADILIDYLGGTLEQTQGTELELHVKDCPDCRRLLEVWDRLDDWKAPAVADDFDQRLYARIAQESRLPWWRKLLLPSAARSSWGPTVSRPLWRPAIPLAAACAVLVLALVVRDPDATLPATNVAHDKGSGDKVTLVDKSNVEEVEQTQVEQALDDLELLTPVAPASPGVI